MWYHHKPVSSADRVVRLAERGLAWRAKFIADPYGSVSKNSVQQHCSNWQTDAATDGDTILACGLLCAAAGKQHPQAWRLAAVAAPPASEAPIYAKEYPLRGGASVSVGLVL